CDSQHVVFNARYGDYVDLAITEFLRASMPGRDPFDGSFEIQTVRQLIEWQSPFRFRDTVEVTVRPTRFGTTSFTIGFEMRRAGEPEIVASAELVYVHVDSKTWTKLPLPAERRRMLETGALGKVTDHAGWTIGRS
ncbi:MAG TPA: acyl-CoA thioesterase, partial [Hyphomicrobiaceae bacterium]|nr:acyl-CoA thioesterase [Hyphomicrobiaceae bacterium]